MGALSNLSTVTSSTGACSSNSRVADIGLAVSGVSLLGVLGGVSFSVAVLGLATSCTGGGGRGSRGDDNGGDMCRDSGEDLGCGKRGAPGEKGEEAGVVGVCD